MQTNHRTNLCKFASMAWLLGLCLLTGCQSTAQLSLVGEIEHTGVLAGFAEGTESAPGKKLFFEPSAIIRNGNEVLIANDKPIPGKSPVLQVPLSEFQKPYVASSAVGFLDVSVFKESMKIESFASAGDWDLAATDFEWITENPKEADSYNNLLAWPAGKPEQARILCPSERSGVTSSSALRAAFAAALVSPAFPAGPPYYKIEGLVSPSSKTLVFGIREIGTDYEHPDFSFILLCADLVHDAKTGVTISKKFEKILDFKPTVPGLTEVSLGLSSLEIDQQTQRIYALTSYEKGEKIGAYLWTFTMSSAGKCSEPSLIRDAGGNPIHFAHKAEGLVPLGGGKLLIICDDDKVLSSIETTDGTRNRKHNEAVFFIVSVNTDR